MKIGILGTGTVGQTLGAGLKKLGHEVMIGSRNPQKEEAQKMGEGDGRQCRHVCRGRAIW